MKSLLFPVVLLVSWAGRAAVAQPAQTPGAGVVLRASAQGFAALAARDAERALVHFDQALAHSPEDVLALHGRGAALARLGLREGAQRTLERALNLCRSGCEPIRLDLAFPQNGTSDFRVHVSMGPDL